MLPFWKRLLGKPAPAEPDGSDATNTGRMGRYPNTEQSPAADEREVKRAELFEPALRHLPRAFRLGDPLFPEAEVGRRWHDTRQQVMDHILQMISNSLWKDHLVLRGSLLLKIWLGEAAREPGDMDWVFRPANIGIDSPLSRELFGGLIAMVSERSGVADAVIQVAEISMDDIWTYERASGRRIVFPWKAAGLPPGSVQMDVVFGEELLSAPIQTPFPSSSGTSTLLWTANKELSLAWKLLWLETDSYPQGKDLYDATLLAEQSPLPFDLLIRVLQSGDWNPAAELRSDFPMNWEVDWDNFKLEYSWVEGEAEDWQVRLTQALTPTFRAVHPGIDDTFSTSATRY